MKQKQHSNGERIARRVTRAVGVARAKMPGVGGPVRTAIGGNGLELQLGTNVELARHLAATGVQRLSTADDMARVPSPPATGQELKRLARDLFGRVLPGRGD